MKATKTRQMYEAIAAHGRNLIRVFNLPAETEPVALCKLLRRLEKQAHQIGLRLCNGPEYPNEDGADRATDAVLRKVNKVLGNVREYQPKTGAKCVCKRGIQRDNCGACEGTGFVIDFAAIRARKPLIPVFINRDPRGYALKIRDDWMREHNPPLHRDWGGYGIIAPDLTPE